MDLLEKLTILSSKIERLILDRDSLKKENEELRIKTADLETVITKLNAERDAVREKVENLLSRIG
jgi:cell division protein ZapB